MTPEEVAAAAMYLKDTIGKDGVQELISNLSKDKGSYLNALELFFNKYKNRKYIQTFAFTFSSNPISLCSTTEGKILVEDIVKLASQTDEANGEEAARV